MHAGAAETQVEADAEATWAASRCRSLVAGTTPTDRVRAELNLIDLHARTVCWIRTNASSTNNVRTASYYTSTRTCSVAATPTHEHASRAEAADAMGNEVLGDLGPTT
jgi:hypothetical protein